MKVKLVERPRLVNTPTFGTDQSAGAAGGGVTPWAISSAIRGLFFLTPPPVYSVHVWNEQGSYLLETHHWARGDTSEERIEKEREGRERVFERVVAHVGCTLIDCVWYATGNTFISNSERAKSRRVSVSQHSRLSRHEVSPVRRFSDHFFREGVILIVQGPKLIEGDILLCVQSKMAEPTEREREKQYVKERKSSEL